VKWVIQLLISVLDWIAKNRDLWCGQLEDVQTDRRIIDKWRSWLRDRLRDRLPRNNEGDRQDR